MLPLLLDLFLDGLGLLLQFLSRLAGNGGQTILKGGRERILHCFHYHFEQQPENLLPMMLERPPDTMEEGLQALL